MASRKVSLQIGGRSKEQAAAHNHIFRKRRAWEDDAVAAATAVRCAEKEMKTIAISIDVAHSLSDAFQLDVDLHDYNRSRIPID
jgi:hypothetical protein